MLTPIDHALATVFFDRDGTLNHDTSYIKTPEELVLFPDAAASVKRCNDAGIRVLVITNQSGLARGYFSQEDLDAVHCSLRERLREGDAWIDDIFVCPHHPEAACVCRKPKTGMIEQAMARYPIDRTKSYVIGDKSIDLELAARAHIKGLLVKTSPYSEEALGLIQTHHLPAAHVANCLREAVEWVVNDVERI